MKILARLFRAPFRALRRRKGPPPIVPMDPRDQLELDLLRQRRELRERAGNSPDDGGCAQ